MTTVVTTATLLAAVIMGAAWIIGAREHAAHARRRAGQSQSPRQAGAPAPVLTGDAPAGIDQLDPERARFERRQQRRRRQLKHSSRRELVHPIR